MSINRILYNKPIMDGIVNYVDANLPDENIKNNDGNLVIIKSPNETLIDLSSNINIKQLTIYDNTENILIGKSNGISDYYGDGNIHVGIGSGKQEFIGAYNVGLGFQALSETIKGDKNIAIGTNALYNDISGNNNIGIGEYAFGITLKGNNNIGIGSYAGFKSPLLSSGTFNNTICIGNRSQVNHNNSGILKFIDIDNIQYPQSGWFWFGDPDNGFINLNCGYIICSDVSCNNVKLPKLNYKRGTQEYPTNTINHSLTYALQLENNLSGYLNYTYDSVNGDYITFLKAGTYAINASVFTSANGGSNVYLWLSRNTATTTSYSGVSVNNLLSIHKSTASDYGFLSWTGHISANDVIRVNASNIGPNVAAVNTMLEITNINVN